MVDNLANSSIFFANYKILFSFLIYLLFFIASWSYQIFLRFHYVLLVLSFFDFCAGQLYYSY